MHIPAINAVVVFIWIYGILALGHVAVQMVLGHLDYRRHARDRASAGRNRLGSVPTVTVVVPSYNEDPATMVAVIDSILAQRGVELEVFVVDDCSPNRAELLERAYSGYADDPRVTVLLPDRNRGKRECQADAFRLAGGEFIVTVDSDTVLHERRGILTLLQDFADPEVGAVTGDVRVENRRDGFLATLISLRYWTAFNQERAAQSLFGVVMCCSGPFSAWRASVVRDVLDDYVGQRFLGRRCGYGDDRHLTNLVLREGLAVRYQSGARAWTYVPTTMRAYVKQQVRWNKSFYREALWTAKHTLRKHHWYLTYDLAMQVVLPFLLVAAIVVTFWQVGRGDGLALVWYLATLIAIALGRALYGLYRTADPRFLLFVAYAFIHVTVLIPVRFYALARLRDTRWGTRTGAAIPGGAVERGAVRLAPATGK